MTSRFWAHSPQAAIHPLKHASAHHGAIAALGSLTSSGHAHAEACTRRALSSLTSQSHSHFESGLRCRLSAGQLGIAALVCWLPWRRGEPL